ncbi:MAG: tRNA (adenosine(37)-N6)-threonylcarbamoyltransferase complex transferase subunit TsaD [Bacteroidia bacterium]|nr:tRNA (adenosine(37)-N6)-threonylcarbamoyltransferase complex transferase subunit TsaD [Bacteroidia bacterium]
MPKILAIESSCDDTAIAVCCGGKILASFVSSQAQAHTSYGGVLPELASRIHQQQITPLARLACETAKIKPADLDAVACTAGPGLLGSLLVGVSFAKGLALALAKPLIAVNHLQGHYCSLFINQPKPVFPMLCLTVSGGHTQLVLVHEPLKAEVISQTRDDAAGEVFDKAAKLLSLPYPGGPSIDRYAQTGNPERFTFPVSQLPNFEYTFSGLKTALLYFLKEKLSQNPDFINQNIYDICASFQSAVVKQLVSQLTKAARTLSIKHIGLSGGVAANSALRKAVTDICQKESWLYSIASPNVCSDNAAMIALAAHYQYLQGTFSNQTLVPYSSMGSSFSR